MLREGTHDAAVRPARMSSSLLETTFTAPGVMDPRLVDPLLAEVVDKAAMEARARGFRAGHAAGYAAGLEEGRALLAEQREKLAELDEQERLRRAEQHSTLIANITEAVYAALDLQQPLLEDLYGLIAETAVELAEELIGHHLRVGECGARDAVLRALRESPVKQNLVLHLHPADAELTAAIMADDPDYAGHPIVADERVERFGAVAVTENLEVDAQYGPAIARAKEVLRG